jgi:protein-S-isoprenylcysteine O-methyltransferase Ste14
MTVSASTPRLRITQFFYALLTLSGLVAGAPPRPVAWATLATFAGFLCVAAACLGRIWCSAFIAGRKDVALVTTGPYAWCRHPLYAWSLLAGLGLGLATQTWLWPVLAVAVLGLLFSREIPREERLLAQRHGAAFTAYAARTPALWPRRPTAVTQVSEIQLRPDLFRKAFLDAGTMLVLFGLVTLFAALRRSGSLPTLLPLP